MQIIQLDDVVVTALFFLSPLTPSRLELEIVGPERLTFNDVVAAYGSWLGLRPAWRVDLPDWLVDAMYRIGALSIALYLFAGAFWLPVVWMQMRMRDIA